MDFNLRQVVAVLVCLIAAPQATLAESDCSAPHCTFVGEAKPWPDAAPAAKHELRFGRFSVLVDGKWDFIAPAPDSGLILKYPAAKISLSLTTVADSGIDAALLEKSPYRLIDIPKIIFSPPGGMPSSPEAAKIQAEALQVKRIFYTGATDAAIFSKGVLSAYSANVDFNGITNITTVTSSSEPDVYLQIMVLGPARGIPEQLISGITFKEER